MGSAAKASNTRSIQTKVELVWNYKNFKPKMQLFEVKSNKAVYVSETAIVKKLDSAPIGKPLSNEISVEADGSRSAVLVVENNEDQDLYFFAVPHEVHPAHASVGHYFQCLCVGRAYKVPKKSIWYRIVRINLNSTFEKMKTFKIEHQIVGLSEKEALTIYRDRLYNYE